MEENKKRKAEEAKKKAEARVKEKLTKDNEEATVSKKNQKNQKNQKPIPIQQTVFGSVNQGYQTDLGTTPMLMGQPQGHSSGNTQTNTYVANPVSINIPIGRSEYNNSENADRYSSSHYDQNQSSRHYDDRYEKSLINGHRLTEAGFRNTNGRNGTYGPNMTGLSGFNDTFATTNRGTGYRGNNGIGVGQELAQSTTDSSKESKATHHTTVADEHLFVEPEAHSNSDVGVFSRDGRNPTQEREVSLIPSNQTSTTNPSKKLDIREKGGVPSIGPAFDNLMMEVKQTQERNRASIQSEQVVTEPMVQVEFPVDKQTTRIDSSRSGTRSQTRSGRGATYDRSKLWSDPEIKEVPVTDV